MDKLFFFGAGTEQMVMGTEIFMSGLSPNRWDCKGLGNVGGTSGAESHM